MGSEGQKVYDAAINSGVYMQMSRNAALRANVCRSILARLEHKAQLGIIDIAQPEFTPGAYCGSRPPPHKLESTADPAEYSKYIQSKA